MSYYRTILKGSIGAVETWSCSINWGIFGASPDVADQPAVDAIANALRAWITAANTPTNLRNLMSTSGTIDIVRVEQRAEDETTLAVNEALLASPPTGLNAPTKTPQDCLVISLRTTTPGPSGRGRFYWPALAATLSTSFQLTSPTSAAVAADARTFLNGIGAQMNAAFASLSEVKTVVLSVRSQKNHVNHNVNQLQVGSVLDTQRRRRDSLPEAYSSVAYP